MSYLQNPDDFYRKFSNDSFYRDLIFALYGFSILCFIWAAWGLWGTARSRNWEKATATYQQNPGDTGSRWQVLCFEHSGETVPLKRLYFGGNPPPLGFGPDPIPNPATIYFNPDNPSDNVVYRKPSWMTYLLLIIGTAFLRFIPFLKSAIAI